MILLVVKNFSDPVDFDTSGTKGPIAGFQGAPSEYGAAARGEGAAVGGDGRTVVLNGFPSFLHNRCYGYQKKQGSLNR